MYPFAPVVDEVAELVDVMKTTPQELLQILAVAQLIGVPVPSIQEEIVGTEQEILERIEVELNHL